MTPEPVPAPNPTAAGPPGPRRRRLALSLRMLMLLILVAGVAIGWAVRRVRSQQQAVATIRAAGGRVAYDFQFDLDPIRQSTILQTTEPPAPAWVRRWLGDDLFRTVASASLFRPVGPDEARAVAALDGLQDLNLADVTDLTPERLAEMTRGPHLARLRLGGPRGRGPNPDQLDALMTRVGEVATLREVVLSQVAVSDAALLRLGRLPGLTDLSIGICPNLSDQGMARTLAALGPSLTSFSWSRGPKPISQTLEALRGHQPGLQRLALAQTTVDAADYPAIGRLTGLTMLNLQQSGITDEGLRHLAPLRRLRRLWINAPGITDAGMATVRGFPDLEYLDLSWSQVGDAGLADLAGLTRLQTLRLGSAVTDAGTPHLAGLRRLETLIFGGSALTDAGLIPLAGLTRLKMVGLPNSTVTPAGVARLQATCPDADVVLGLAGQMIAAPNRTRAGPIRPAAGGAPASPKSP